MIMFYTVLVLIYGYDIVDLEYSTRFANLSKAANVAYFGLLTSQVGMLSIYFE